MNPEDTVIAEINALIDEQLDRGPVDDYSINRYPVCNLCPHDWHGVRCALCSCEASTGEVEAAKPIYPQWRTTGGSVYIDAVESVRLTCQFCGQPADDGHGHGGGGYRPYRYFTPEECERQVEAQRQLERGYTLADLRAMQENTRAGRYVYQEWFLTPEEREREAEALRQLEQLPPDLQDALTRTIEYIHNTLAMITGLPELEPINVETWFGRG